MIPTAEEFINQEQYYQVIGNRYIPQVMIDFAKLHVEKALRRASESKYKYQPSPMLMTKLLPFSENQKETILNAYSLENIK